MSFLIALLFRCFLVAIVEPGRMPLSELVWKEAKLGLTQSLEKHITSEFIRVEEFADSTVLHVGWVDDVING